MKRFIIEMKLPYNGMLNIYVIRLQQNFIYQIFLFIAVRYFFSVMILTNNESHQYEYDYCVLRS